MARASWRSTLVAQQAAGTLLNTYTTAKSVINAQAQLVLPAGYLQEAGQVLRIQAVGAISNIVTTPGTITFQVQLGPTANIIAFTTGAIQLNATAHTTIPFWFDATLTVRSVGNGVLATLMGQATVTGQMFTATAGQTDGANTHTVLLAPNTAPAVGTGFDSTIANLLDFWAGFSINNAGNGIQIHQYTVASEN